MCVPCGEGLVNIRVGALILKDGKILMVESSRGYLYSVGGRILSDGCAKRFRACVQQRDGGGCE